MGSRLEPALAHLLQNLPSGDPDEREFAEVWMAHCEDKAVVPVGVETEIELGPWRGPMMQLAHVELFARKLSSGEEQSCSFSDGQVPVWRGVYVRVIVLVE